MSIIRTDEQADALEILKLIIKTADFYRAMGELLTQENVQHRLFETATERETFIEPFQNVLEELDELPASPDADKEFFDELGGKVSQWLSADSKKAVYDKCLEKDEDLTTLINNTALGEQSTAFRTLLDSLRSHLDNTKAYLTSI